jgi:hypothetical protein
LQGATTLEAAKAFIERVFGIRDVPQDAEPGASHRGRATVRYVTSYMFVTKEVIDSEVILLHGLEQAEKARDIVATMPYFLRATDEATAMDEQRLRQLQRALDREEAKVRSHAILTKVRAESAAVERVKPRLVEYDRALDEQIRELNAQLRRVDDQIQTWLRQTDETRQLADLAQLRAHLLGRVSFFLEASSDEPRQASRDLNVLRAEIAELEARVDREAKKIKLQRAERKISQFASEALAMLPTVAPCIGSELEFSSREPEVAVIEAGSGAVLRMSDVGPKLPGHSHRTVVRAAALF